MIKLEWNYKPVNYLESTFQKHFENYSLTLDNGIAVIIPNQKLDLNVEDLLNHGYKTILNILKFRQVQTHKKFQLDRNVSIFRKLVDGQIVKDIRIYMCDVINIYEGFAPDITITDINNNEIVNTKKERIDIHQKQFDLLLKSDSDPILEKLMESYDRALNNKNSELVHLFEIRDAIKQKFNGEKEAIKQLNFGSRKWDRLGIICNNLPFKEGRHAGLNGNLQEADESELKEARLIASDLIQSYLKHITKSL